MFAFMSGNTGQDEKKEAEIRAAKKVVNDLVQALSAASPEEAERLSKSLKDFCGASKVLPFDFKNAALQRGRSLECDVNMFAADRMMQMASRLAAAEKMKERGEKLGAARRYFAKACTLGAREDWRKAFQRLNETIMLTGGVHANGPTRAKPLDLAPKAPNRAKPVDCAPKAPNRAKW